MKKILLAVSMFAMVSLLASCTNAEATEEGKTDDTQNFQTEYSTESSHDHGTYSDDEELLSSQIGGYCGNTSTVILFPDGKSVSFMYENSVYLTDLLLRLDYKQDEVCECDYEYVIRTEFNDAYYLNLTQHFVRCDKWQMNLTESQVQKIREIISWSEEFAISGEYVGYNNIETAD